tara:strand:- start:710 stop:1030 length:321 start_codon:yes stop_codon:yes gene_type:complete
MSNELEPIPFMGYVNIDPELAVIDKFIAENYGNNPENVPKYVVLGDGSVYIFHKEEHRYALREQTPPVQERIQATEGERGAASPQCSGEGTICDGQEGRGQVGEGY